MLELCVGVNSVIIIPVIMGYMQQFFCIYSQLVIDL